MKPTSTCRKYFPWSFSHSWLINEFATRLTRRVPLVEQELLTRLEHLSLPPVFTEVLVNRSLGLCVCFEDRCLFFFLFSFDNYVIFPSIYGFWLPLWHHQTLLLTLLVNIYSQSYKRVPRVSKMTTLIYNYKRF